MGFHVFWLWSQQSQGIQGMGAGTSLLYKRNCVVQQFLKAGTWLSQMNFTAFYFGDGTHWHMGTFSNGYVVATQQVVWPCGVVDSALVSQARGAAFDSQSG